MPTHSLKEIEQTLSTLWTNRQTRESFLSHDANDEASDIAVEGTTTLDKEILSKVDRKGVALYSSLITYGHHELMMSVYPGCAKVIGKHWRATVEDYLKVFPPNHYNFNRLAQRFPQYLAEYGNLKKHPYIAELAEYEWLELELMEDQRKVSTGNCVDLSSPEQVLSLRPVVNPVLVLKQFKYPIAKIVDWLEQDARLPRRVKADSGYMAIFRNAQTFECKFLELGDVAAALLEHAINNPDATFADLAKLAVSLTPKQAPQTTVNDFLALIDKLQILGALIGTETEKR